MCRRSRLVFLSYDRVFGIGNGSIYTCFRSFWGGLKPGAGKLVMIPRPSSSSCFKFASFPVARCGRARRSSRHRMPPHISEAAEMLGVPPRSKGLIQYQSVLEPFTHSGVRGVRIQANVLLLVVPCIRQGGCLGGWGLFCHVS
jgi:hypothetical protein